MHDLKFIRNNFELFKKKITERNSKINFDEIRDLDKQNRELIQKKENFEKEKKLISKSNKKDNIEKSKDLSKKILELATKQSQIDNKLKNILSNLPNLAMDSVPVGKDEKK